MSDLTDKEITEACARAVNLDVDALATGRESPFANFVVLRDGSIYNPLTDRAQAMELVGKLLEDGIGMYVGPHHAAFCRQNTASEVFRMLNDMTKIENLLRAICLCAARVQIEKEKGNA